MRTEEEIRERLKEEAYLIDVARKYGEEISDYIHSAKREVLKWVLEDKETKE
jgi:hypothetical protein